MALVVAKTKAEIKMEEANEILEKLGLGLENLKLKLSDFSDIYSIRHNHKETNFTKGDDLKKIQFKEFNGGAEQVDNLSGTKIKVSLDWDGTTKKFPNNMKFSFENTQMGPYLELRKSGKSVQILKKVKNVQNIFRVENKEDKCYLVKSN